MTNQETETPGNIHAATHPFFFSSQIEPKCVSISPGSTGL